MEQPATMVEPPMRAIRNCDGCTMCCKILSVEELGKPGGSWCPHCDVGVGCRIYEKRPGVCRTFQCGYLVEPELDERWKPSTSHLVIVSPGANRLNIHVDPQRPTAWRREPYYSSIREWTREALEIGAQVVIFVGIRVWMLLPDRDLELGALGPRDQIVATKKFAPNGVNYDVRIVTEKDAPTETFRMLPFSKGPSEYPWFQKRDR